MTSPNTYPLLVQAIIDMAEDDSTEFTDFIPTAINMAEDRLFRDLKLNYSTEGTVPCVVSNPSVTKPTDLRLTTGIFIIISGERVPLIKRSSEFLMDYWPSTSTVDVPKYYSDDTLTTWRLAPTPASTYSLQVQYTAQPTYLTVATPSNIYTEKYSDMMFYATMVNMCEFMKDTERKQEWESRLMDAINTVNDEGIKTTKEDNPNKVGN